MDALALKRALQGYVPLKSRPQIDSIRASCCLCVELLETLEPFIRPGVTTEALERLASRFLAARGAAPALQDRFPAALSASVNAAAHGLPGPRPLREGDLLTLDVALRLEGWCGDAARSYLVGRGGREARILLLAARRAAGAGVAAVKAGVRLGDVGAAVQAEARRWDCAVIEECTGHGLGRSLHEEPAVPFTGQAGEGLEIEPGMVLTVEPVLTLGSGPGGRLRVSEDGWTMITASGAPAAGFEHTVAVFPDRTEVLTLSGRGPQRLDFGRLLQ